MDRVRPAVATGRAQTPNVRWLGQVAVTCQSNVTDDDPPAAFFAVTVGRSVSAPRTAAEAAVG